MDNTPTPAASVATKPGLSVQKIILIVLGIVLVTAALAVGGTVWWVKHNFDPKPIKPVVLNSKEKADLESKLAVFGDPPMAPVVIQAPSGSTQPQQPTPTASNSPAVPPNQQPTQPQVTPGEENRTIILTEREINAYLAQRKLGENVQISFSEGKIVAGIIVEVPQDFPMLSGQKVRARITFGAGLTPDHKLSLIFDDLSVGGISLPNAWLGDLKGVDLVAKNLESDPGVQRFISGIQSIEIQQGSAKIILNK